MTFHTIKDSIWTYIAHRPPEMDEYQCSKAAIMHDVINTFETM